MEAILLVLFGLALLGAGSDGGSSEDDTGTRYDDDQDGDGTANAADNDGVIAGNLLDNDLFGWALGETETTDTTFPHDTITGGAGNDALFGGNGTDTLDGGDGDDILTGGQDDDDLTGGNGTDRFTFAQGDGQDTVNDLSLNEQLQFSGLSDAPTISDDGRDARIDYGAGDFATLLGTTAQDLVISGPDEGGDYTVIRISVPDTDAVIGGAISGSVTAGDAATLTATGMLSVSDPNPGEAAFVPQTDIAGTYGSFDLTADGIWTYTADNSQVAIQALNSGDSLTDSFTATSVDGTTQGVSITLFGATDPIGATDPARATVGGDTTGTVTEDDAATLTATGTLTVTDPNPGEAAFVAQSAAAGLYGTFDLAADGSWTYSADNSQTAIQALNTGESLTDRFAVASLDGTTQLVDITLTGVTDPIGASIGGTISAAITEDDAATLTATGTLTVIDPNPGEAAFVSQTGVSGAYGNFTLASDGIWTYFADNDPAAIQRLDAGETLTDSFNAATVDGATQVVTVTLNGTDDPVVAVALSDVSLAIGGFVVNGVSNLDGSGASVSMAGDVNGDGLEDVIIGAPGDDPNGNASGSSFVVFGKADGVPVDLSDVQAGTGGFVINGANASDFVGQSVSAAGDVNGDGLDDVIVGGSGISTNGANAGAAYVVFGKADTTAVDLSNVAAGTGGFVINGATADDRAGYEVESVGDLNGDGFDDLFIGAFHLDPNGVDSGGAYVVFGKADGTAIELSNIGAGTGGFVINGENTGDRVGRVVGSGGDVNGDGLNDFIVGSTGISPGGTYSGGAYVIFGKTDGAAVELSTVASGTGGFVINGASAGDYAGSDLSIGGDVDGDGLDDLLVGAVGADPNGTSSGAAYVVFGKTDGAAVDLSAVTAGTGGFAINGAAADDDAHKVSAAADFNGDGLADIIVGAPGADTGTADTGAAYVVFGKADTATVELSDIASGDGGFILNGGGTNNQAGDAIAGGGDVNGDGFVDLIIGAQGASPNGAGSGASYVVFGSNVTFEVDQIGTSGPDTLLGDTRDNVIYGAAGDDTLDGAGGTDRLSGGAGADTFVTQDVAGSTTVIDFDPQDDRLDVSAFRFGSFAAFQGSLEGLDYQGNPVSGSDLPVKTTRMTLDGDTVVLLEGVKPSALTAANLTPASTANVLLSQVAQNESAFVINGINSDDYSGRSVSNAGDVNGDGLDDIIIGAPSADPNGAYSGQSYVVFGKADGTSVELSDVLAGTGGFAINGAAVSDSSGYVGAGGDVNGDGLDDLVVGSIDQDFGARSNVGFASVVFGKADTATVELSDINAGIGGFAVVGAETFSGFPEFLSIGGDVNGDGLDDLFFGAEEADPNGTSSGKSYVVFGKTDGTVVDLTDVEAETGSGFVVTGNAIFDRAGRAFAAGDINGDGREDLIIGARGDDPTGSNSGAAFIVFGKSDFAGVALTDIEAGTGGFVINGAAPGDDAGFSVAGLGDLDGDGLDDVVIGANDAAPNGVDSGAAFVVFGKTDGTAIELANIAAGTGGFVINGADANDEFGERVSAAGDVNGDGVGDILIAAPYLFPDEIGTSYVVYGKADRTAVEASDIENGVGGFAIFGANAYDYAGASLGGGGDINGDGLDDLIVGAWGVDTNGGRSGSTYVIFGSERDAAVDTFGTASADTLTGTATSEAIFGAAGDDTLDGGGGTDRLSGGAGDDTFVMQNVAGTSTVMDFDPDDDVLDLSAFGFDSFADVQAAMSGLDFQGNTVAGPELAVKTTRIALDGDTTFLLSGIKPSDITAAQVIL